MNGGRWIIVEHLAGHSISKATKSEGLLIDVSVLVHSRRVNRIQRFESVEVSGIKDN